MQFLSEDFLLSNASARRLYHEFAADQPIYDYHCHLPPADLAGNRRFSNLFEAWLEGDHYKWRAMRANGIDERYCTGDADPFEKFEAFARTVPLTLRNPLYHWTHLELQRYFNIDTLLNADTAREIWDEANRQLQTLSVADIFQRFKVALVGTTDSPPDDLKNHQRIAAADTYPDTTIVPAFRPDKAHALADVIAWNKYVDDLGQAAGIRVGSLDDLLEALAKRHAFFHQQGSRLSDHGLTHLPAAACDHQAAASIFNRVRQGDNASTATPITDAEQAAFAGYLMLELAKLDHAAGWTHQLHLGAMRNNNGWASQHLGPDTGFDSIGDHVQGPGLRRHLGTLAQRQTLPQTILYNLNPADNYLFASMAGNFQGVTPGAPNSRPGKIQYGSGWWFLDQKEGMTMQLNALSNLGLLPRFVGMLTDSRSFLSYPRHEYFRRLLCDLLGRDIEAGELPADYDLLGNTVRDISFRNAKAYFGMQLKGRFAD